MTYCDARDLNPVVRNSHLVSSHYLFAVISGLYARPSCTAHRPQSSAECDSESDDGFRVGLNFSKEAE